MVPIYYFVSLFICGVLISYHFATSTPVVVVVLILIFLLTSISTIKEKRLHIICVATIGLLWGMLCVNLNRAEPIRLNLDGEKIIFDGYVRGSPKYNRNSTVYNISVERYILDGTLTVRKFDLQYKVRLSFAEPIRGDLIRGRCKVLMGEDGNAHCIADKSSPPFVIERKGFTFLNQIDEYKKRVSRFIFSTYSGDIADILLALATGNSSELRYYVRSIFSKTGTAHILAISGTHIGLISLIFYFLFRFALLPFVYIRPFSLKKVAAPPLILTLICISIYFGDTPSVLRATIMIIVYLFSIMIDRERDILASLFVAFVIIVSFDPDSIRDIGFQLSFLSVLGIIIFLPSLIKWDYGGPSFVFMQVIRSLSVLFLTSLAASLFTLPLVAYHFGMVSIVGLIANVVIVPFIGFISLPLILAGTLLCGLSPTIAEFLYNGAFVSLGHLFELNSLFAAAPFSFFKIFRPTSIEIALYYIILVSFVFRSRIPIYRIVIVLQVFLLVMVSVSISRIYFQSHKPQVYVKKGIIVAIDKDLRAHLVVNSDANSMDIKKSVDILRSKRIVKVGYTNLGLADDLYIKDHLYTEDEKDFISVSESNDAIINFINKSIYLFNSTEGCPPESATFVISMRISREAIRRLYSCNVRPESLIVAQDVTNKNTVDTLKEVYGESYLRILLLRDGVCEIKIDEK